MTEGRFVLPQDDSRRKLAPMARGFLDYFPAAMFAVAEHSKRSDMKHNPGSTPESDPTWNRPKSSDHLDCILRHMAERHTDPAYHMRAIAWRAMAALQEYMEAHEGAAPGAASRNVNMKERLTPAVSFSSKSLTSARLRTPELSAQPCGCDPGCIDRMTGKPHICEQHALELLAQEPR